MSSLQAVSGMVEDFIKTSRLDGALIPQLQLVLEELFVNSVKYNPRNNHPVHISLIRDVDRIVIIFTDFKVPPFDVTRVPTYKSEQGLAERRIGGVGIHLVKKMMDDINYEYQDGNSRITLTKYLEKDYVQHKNRPRK
jgi:anti-sigma regulatory factor (Ser/Thr protein kinase)